MVWISIIKELQEAFTDIVPNVIIGALEPADFANEGVIFIIRDSESVQSMRNNHLDEMGTVRLFIESWIRDDSTDITNGYSQLAEVEQAVIGALGEWVMKRSTTDFNILACNVVEIIGDGDVKRPLVGSRIVLDIQYNR